MFTACGLTKNFPGLPTGNFLQHLIELKATGRIRTFFSFPKGAKKPVIQQAIATTASARSTIKVLAFAEETSEKGVFYAFKITAKGSGRGMPKTTCRIAKLRTLLRWLRSHSEKWQSYQ